MGFREHDFGSYQGLPASAARALKKRFSSWAQVAASLPEELMETKGVSDAVAIDLIETAKAHVRQDAKKRTVVEENVFEEPIALVRDRKGRLPKQETEAEREARRAQRYVLSSKPADFAGPDGAGRITNIKRRRKLLTPAICDKCGFDMLDKMGLDQWDRLSPATQDDVRRRVAAHKDMAHGVENELIIDGLQLDGIGRDSEEAIR